MERRSLPRTSSAYAAGPSTPSSSASLSPCRTPAGSSLVRRARHARIGVARPSARGGAPRARHRGSSSASASGCSAPSGSLLSPRARHEDGVATDVHAPDPSTTTISTTIITTASAHHEHAPDHSHALDSREHGPVYHSHGWGVHHTHDLDVIARTRPSLTILLGLGIAGGLLPIPARSPSCWRRSPAASSSWAS